MTEKQLWLYVKRSGVWVTRAGEIFDPTTTWPRFEGPQVFSGATKPTGSLDSGTRNVGPRMADSALSNYSGDIVLDGTKKPKGLYITGRVSGRGLDTVTDCVIRGPAPASVTTTDAMARGTSYNFGGALFEYCRFDGAGREHMLTNCVGGGGYTLRYCELLRGVDGVAMNNTGNATVEFCRIYHSFYTAYWNDATGAPRTTTYTDFGGKTWVPPFDVHDSGDLHGDGIQIQGYAGWKITGNYIGGTRGSSVFNSQLDPTVAADYAVIQAYDADPSFVNAALMVNANGTQAVGLLAEHNIFHGGNASVNLAVKGTDLLAGVTVRNNLFVRTSPSYGYRILASATHKATLSNNLYNDTRTAVPVSTV